MSFLLTLAVENINRSEYFYRQILGLSLERLPGRDAGGDSLLLRQGDAAILLRAAEVLEARHPVAFQHLSRQNRGVGVSLDFSVADLKSIHRALERHQHTILYELEDEEHDFRELWCYDPDHYLIILSQTQTRS
ncbi:MAG: VOC family protein [Desulfuromonadaceae bacterium]|nr:VOC family protein [Desulfuromonadaceae bacterium]